MSKNYPLTQDKFTAALAALNLPPGNTGTFSPPGHSEITLGYAFVNGSLQVTILHSSWFESSGMIFAALDPHFA